MQTTATPEMMLLMVRVQSLLLKVLKNDEPETCLKRQTLQARIVRYGMNRSGGSTMSSLSVLMVGENQTSSV